MAAQTDVIIIGAGVSGLAAASELAGKGWSVQIVEARPRIGGRIFSAKPKGWPVSAELGAEFIHGGNSAMKRQLKRAGIATRPIDASMWWRGESTAVIGLIPDFWERVGRVVARIPADVGDRSFGEFLRQSGKEVSPADRYLSGLYVGSFEAAPIDKISAAALRADQAGTQTNDFKVVGRYDRLVRAMEKTMTKKSVALRLNATVDTVRWREGSVRVQGHGPARESFEYVSAGVVITLPLGVLKAKQVRFLPRLKEKDSVIAKMGWGHVVRVVLRFRRGFWTAPFIPHCLGANQGRDFGFVNAPGQSIPVWWALNAPAPVLCGWAGGEVSRPLRAQPPAKVREEALHSLAAIFGTSVQKICSWLADWQYHPWTTDPFSRGSYSFPAADCKNGAEELARPVSSTIFFAGEATAEDYGTVHGAMESGLRAAFELDKVLRRRRRVK